MPILGDTEVERREEGQEPKRALEVLAEMRRRGVEPNVITYSAAISACKKRQ